jgi:hypothetical protein
MKTNKIFSYKKKLRDRCIKLCKSDEDFVDVIKALLKDYFKVAKVYELPDVRLVEFEKQLYEIENI